MATNTSKKNNTQLSSYAQSLNSANTASTTSSSGSSTGATNTSSSKNTTTSGTLNRDVPTGSTLTPTTNTSSNTSTDSSTYEDDLTAQLLRDENWKALYNTRIQLANARALGQKYYADEIANSGYASQGYGSSLAASQNTAYANAVQNAYEDYYSQENEITQDLISRTDNAQTELDEQVITFLQNAADESAAYNILKNYGYLEQDDNGLWHFTDSFNSLDDTRKAYIISALETAGWENPDVTNANYVYNVSDLDGTYVTYTLDLTGDNLAELQRLYEESYSTEYDTFEDYILFSLIGRQKVGGNGSGKNKNIISDSMLKTGLETLSNLLSTGGSDYYNTMFMVQTGTGTYALLVIDENGSISLIDANEASNAWNSWGGSKVNIVLGSSQKVSSGTKWADVYKTSSSDSD